MNTNYRDVRCYGNIVYKSSVCWYFTPSMCWGSLFLALQHRRSDLSLSRKSWLKLCCQLLFLFLASTNLLWILAICFQSTFWAFDILWVCLEHTNVEWCSLLVCSVCSHMQLPVPAKLLLNFYSYYFLSDHLCYCTGMI